MRLDPHQASVGGAASARGTPGPRVCVVVLAHNRLADTLECLRSCSQLEGDRRELLLIDNGSSDGTAEAVRARHPEVTVIAHDHNLGFAEGNNTGIRAALDAGADYVFLLNNDTTIAPDAIARCVDVAERHLDAAAVCPLIHFADPPDVLWYAGATFDPRRAHSGRMLGYSEADAGQFTNASQTDRMTGAAVLLVREALERVGVLDSELFFLYEDVDWSLRARRAGYRIYLAPAGKVWHRVSSTAGGEHSPLIGYYDTRNHVVVCRRHARLAWPAGPLRDLGILLVHLAAVRRAGERAAYAGAVFRGWRDGLRGSLGPAR